MRFLLHLLFLCFGSLPALAQVQVQGIVLDESSQQAIPYATVLAKNSSDSSLIAGTTSDENGAFSLSIEANNWFLEFSFIGYQTLRLQPASTGTPILQLGSILLKASQEMLAEVELVEEKSLTEFKIDKRVFNVGADLSSQGLSAMEVLDNVPSVTVNIEGEISLRGNTGVQILINGKPSVLAGEGGNALGSISADMIERIEVITNPSAKYQAEGSSGIINIVLKEQEKKGLNGSLSLNTGMPDNHSLGFSLSRRTDKFNLFTQGGVGYRSLPSYSSSKLKQTIGDTLFTLDNEGVEYRNETFYNITLGADYHLNESSVITLAGSFAYEVESQPSNTEFLAYNDQENGQNRWERLESTSATNPKYQYDLQYQKEFGGNEDHTLLISTLGSFFGKDQSSQFEIEQLEGSNGEDNQRTSTSYQRQDYTFKLDYAQPLGTAWSWEAGGQYDMNEVGNAFAVFNQEQGSYIPDSNFINDFTWDQKVLGLYSTGAYEGEAWGLKAGLRMESTNLYTFLVQGQEENNQNYHNWFPSLHGSYKFSPLFQLQAGYSRRVFRPRLWDLNPFFNIRNNFNIRQGNPNLQPEFTDSYELTGVIVLPQWSINSSIYHLFTTEVIERVTVFEDQVAISMPRNLGQKSTTGLELNFKYYPVKWFSLNGDLNLGFFDRQGSFEGQNFDFNNQQFTARVTQKYGLKNDWDFELTGNYQSPFQSLQGQVEGLWFVDFGLRKKIWQGKGIINLGVRDAFASRIRRSTVILDNSLQSYSRTRGRFITLGFSYGFGKGEAMTYSGRRR